jgi:hypothetical protein
MKVESKFNSDKDNLAAHKETNPNEASSAIHDIEITDLYPKVPHIVAHTRGDSREGDNTHNPQDLHP